MSKKLSILLVTISLMPVGMKAEEQADQDTVIINIASQVRVDRDFEEEFLQEAKETGKMLTKRWASVRGVSEIETTVDRDDCNTCKKETVRSEGDNSEEVSASTEETRCSCGKPVQKSCGKCCGKCSSCSSCSGCCK